MSDQALSSNAHLSGYRTQPLSRIVQPRAGDLWTSAEAASAFRVGVSSIKRWTDEGELESVRTPGNHRRYTLIALHRFASIRKIPADLLPPLVGEVARAIVPLPAELTLFEAMRSGDAVAVRQLVEPRVKSVAQRAAFLDRVVGDALREIGERWESGDLTVEVEHRASYMIAEAIDLLRPAIATEGNVAVLACPPSEWHELPLRLVRLVLEWSGWRTEFDGASMPWKAACASAHRRQAKILALSARSPEAFEDGEFEELVQRCNEVGTQVIVGGEWARGGSGVVDTYLRFRTLRGFERWLRTRELES